MLNRGYILDENGNNVGTFEKLPTNLNYYYVKLNGYVNTYSAAAFQDKLDELNLTVENDDGAVFD